MPYSIWVVRNRLLLAGQIQNPLPRRANQDRQRESGRHQGDTHFSASGILRCAIRAVEPCLRACRRPHPDHKPESTVRRGVHRRSGPRRRRAADGWRRHRSLAGAGYAVGVRGLPAPSDAAAGIRVDRKNTAPPRRHSGRSLPTCTSRGTAGRPCRRERPSGNRPPTGKSGSMKSRSAMTRAGRSRSTACRCAFRHEPPSPSSAPMDPGRAPRLTSSPGFWCRMAAVWKWMEYPSTIPTAQPGRAASRMSLNTSFCSTRASHRTLRWGWPTRRSIDNG